MPLGYNVLDIIVIHGFWENIIVIHGFFFSSFKLLCGILIFMHNDKYSPSNIVLVCFVSFICFKKN